MRHLNVKSLLVILAGAACLIVPGVSHAASAKWAAADNDLTTCQTSTNGSVDTITGVTLGGLTNCTYTNVTTTDPNGSTTTATMDGPNWVVVSELSLHVSNSQSIFVTPSLVTGLYTQVKSNGNGISGTSSSATAQVLLRVVDVTSCTLSPSSICATSVPAEPVADCTNGSDIFGCVNIYGAYGVNFDTRILGIQALLGSTDYVDIAEATAQGHSFGFGFDDLTTGTHTIAVEAAVNVSGTGNDISTAAFGLGFTTAESVQLTQGANDMDF